MTNQDPLDETLWQFATHLKRAMGGRQVGGEELNHDQAKAKINSLYISRAEVERAIPQKRNIDDFSGFERCAQQGFNIAIDEFRKKLGIGK